MADAPDTPDPRFLEGVALFNRGEYFEAHEVWEDWWRDCPASERRFAQALIQAAVAVYHYRRGNYAGASRLFHSGRRYMDAYRPTHCGLNVPDFWARVESHVGPALGGGDPPVGPPPVIVLSDTRTGP